MTKEIDIVTGEFEVDFTELCRAERARAVSSAREFIRLTQDQSIDISGVSVASDMVIVSDDDTSFRCEVGHSKTFIKDGEDWRELQDTEEDYPSVSRLSYLLHGYVYDLQAEHVSEE